VKLEESATLRKNNCSLSILEKKLALALQKDFDL